MEANIRQCDHCKIEARSDKEPEKYKDFTKAYIGLCDVSERYGYSNRETATHRLKVEGMLLCGTCLAKIGIIKKEETEKSNTKDFAPADALYDIVRNIIAEELQRQA